MINLRRKSQSIVALRPSRRWRHTAARISKFCSKIESLFDRKPCLAVQYLFQDSVNFSWSTIWWQTLKIWHHLLAEYRTKVSPKVYNSKLIMLCVCYLVVDYGTKKTVVRPISRIKVFPSDKILSNICYDCAIFWLEIVKTSFSKKGKILMYFLSDFCSFRRETWLIIFGQN